MYYNKLVFIFRVSRPILHSGGQSVRPRRGRIVARIHSSELNIPALHKHYINNKQPSHNFPAFAGRLV